MRNRDALRYVAKHLLGTISAGTMKTEDLVPACMGVLKELSPREWLRIRNDSDNAKWFDDGDLEVGGYILDDLFDKLGEYSPPYFYFGAHPDDGADYGWWFDSDQMDAAVHEGEVVKVNAGDPVPKGKHAFVLEVSDHGNITLIRRGKVVWVLV